MNMATADEMRAVPCAVPQDRVMSIDFLFDDFDRLIQSPESVLCLRRFILELAVRGKLVPQDPNNEPASELLKRIKAEKARLVEEGKIRKQKKLLPVHRSEILVEDIPGWIWVRLGEVSTKITKGSTPTSYGYTYENEGVNFVKVESIKGGSLLSENITSFIADETHVFLARSQLAAGDILFSIAGSIGTCAVVTNQVLPANINQALAIIRGTQTAFLAEFLLKSLQSSVARSVLAKARGGAMNNVSLGDIQNLVVPLPPLAEQHRIVAKVNELMILCDCLEAARAEREATRDRLATASLTRLNAPDPDPETFQHDVTYTLNNLGPLTTRPDQVKALRQTILNLAVHGKLVPQDPTDEPASELLKRIAGDKVALDKMGTMKKSKPLPPVNSEDAPFDLPAGWAWTRFPEVGLFGRGKSKHRPRNDPILYDSGKYPFVQTGDVARSGGSIKTYSNLYNDVGLAQSAMWPSGTLCITIAANIANSGILTIDACFPDSIVGLIVHDSFEDARYFEYFLRTVKSDLHEFAPSTAQKNINLGILKEVLIPFPPLVEQRRIVAKVDELMALCDRLEASLNVGDDTLGRLIGALLREALEPLKNGEAAA